MPELWRSFEICRAAYPWGCDDIPANIHAEVSSSDSSEEDSGSDNDTSGEEDEAPAPEKVEEPAVDSKELEKKKVAALPAVEAEDEENKDAAQLDSVKGGKDAVGKTGQSVGLTDILA